MALEDHLSLDLTLAEASVLAGIVGVTATLVIMPRVIRKLRGAGIVGRDINKIDRPEVPEMGGIGVFLGFYVGVFAFLVLHPFGAADERLLLVALITAAGAAMTGVIDDLVELRQRFKAVLPVFFAAPIALFVADYNVSFPILGDISFGLLYPIVLVPLGIACASNGFNILEGYNGMGAGIGLIMAAAMTVLVILRGDGLAALVLLVPLCAALLGFLAFNRYPARVFPGDTMTLLVGAVLAAAAIIGKIEFWGALLFIPHIIEFFLKARGSFEAENFAKRMIKRENAAPRLDYEGRTESLTHIVLRRLQPTEPGVSAVFWLAQFLLSTAIIVGYVLTTS